MFKIENNQKIGAYLSDLIDAKYQKTRRFCKAYLIADGTDPTDANIQNMANRLSQIKKGTKAIQIYDLPIFTDLLGVSCEQILSAGEHSVPQAKRVTNYSIAFSKDPDEWESFINRDDKLILNQDEYCKTILDYALEFGNYDLLKYLMNKGYIWFDSRKDKDYIRNFGAGTSIQRRDVGWYDYGLQAKLNEEDSLRLNLIALAADHDDLDMLEQLRARENPQMYFLAHYLHGCTHDFSESYSERMVYHISRSSDQVLDYFTDEFEIRDPVRYTDGRDGKHVFIFPYISKLLDFMIENKSPFAETALKKAIKHNKSTYAKLCKLIKDLKDDEYYQSDLMKRHFLSDCAASFAFSEKDDTVTFYGFYTTPLLKSNPDGLITNVARITKKSSNPILRHLIEELNESYEQIKSMNEHLGEI